MRNTAAVLALGLLLAGGARAAEIEELAVALDGEEVLVSFHLAGAFTPQLVERVQSGLPTTLFYDLELMRDRKRWFDRNLAETSLTVVGIYDAVRREYLVNLKLDGRLLESRMVHDLVGLERAMTRIERLHVFTLTPQRTRRRLLIRVRAELGTRHVMGFIPSRIRTSWTESLKFRPPPALVEE